VLSRGSYGNANELRNMQGTHFVLGCLWHSACIEPTISFQAFSSAPRSDHRVIDVCTPDIAQCHIVPVLVVDHEPLRDIKDAECFWLRTIKAVIDDQGLIIG
jgi:hypothetical protein